MLGPLLLLLPIDVDDEVAVVKEVIVASATTDPESRGKRILRIITLFNNHF